MTTPVIRWPDTESAPPALKLPPGATVTNFADPYKRCVSCGNWIDGAAEVPGPLLLVPCGHRSDYVDVCPSWGPVDGCGCAEYNARTPQSADIVHDMRPPTPGDGKVY